jgi:hypothetical protein
MSEPNLILSIPYGIVVATSLGLEGYAKHRSPGSGKFFHGKTIMADLALEGDRPAFKYHEEGGWRDAGGDTIAALAAVRAGKRTKTALSNYGFSVTPLSAYRRLFLCKTAGLLLEMTSPVPLIAYTNHVCHEGMTTDEVAAAIGRPLAGPRSVRLFMVIEPVPYLVMTNLTAEEYGWYTTHRPGKIFRQVLFVELGEEHPEIVAASRYEEAREELKQKPTKKTKVVAVGEFLDEIPFRDWVGYSGERRGGLYAGDRTGLSLWQFPATIPRTWDIHVD